MVINSIKLIDPNLKSLQNNFLKVANEKYNIYNLYYQ